MTAASFTVPAPWRAVLRSPGRHALTGSAWRSVGYLLVGALLGVLVLVALIVLLGGGLALLIVGVGVPLLAALPLAAVALGRLERARSRLVDPDTVIDPHQTLERGIGMRELLGVRLRERATWREMVFAVVLGTLLTPLSVAVLGLLAFGAALVITPLVVVAVAPDTVMLVPGRAAQGPWDAVPFSLLGLVTVVASLYLASALASVQIILVRLLLGSREDELGAQVHQLTASRARLAAAFEAERRRIERDLHDGAQQQLGAVLMTLGLAEYVIDTDPGRARELLSRARGQAAGTQQQLRALIRGIHPQILADHGLVAALRDATLGHAPPVELDLRLPRLPGPVEDCAYFVVLEALVNAARHSGASSIVVTGTIAGEHLVVTVADDGCGGADPAAGTGLRGLADRVAILGGTLTVTSPAGGPTIVEGRIPCRA